MGGTWDACSLLPGSHQHSSVAGTFPAGHLGSAEVFVGALLPPPQPALIKPTQKVPMALPAVPSPRPTTVKSQGCCFPARCSPEPLVPCSLQRFLPARGSGHCSCAEGAEGQAWHRPEPVWAVPLQRWALQCLVVGTAITGGVHTGDTSMAAAWP